MTEPEEEFIVPMASGGVGKAKWVAVAALAVTLPLGGWLLYARHQDSTAAEAKAKKEAEQEAEQQRIRDERRAKAKAEGGIPLASAHKPPPGWKPPKKRIPSKELFSVGVAEAGGLLPTALPGRKFGIELPPTWEHHGSGPLLVIRAPDNHFTIIASEGTHANDGNTTAAIDKIGAVNCNWRRGDGPRHGKLGPQQIPAFFNEGVCGHTDGYGLIWIVRVFAGDHVTSLVARYSVKAGDDAEEVLIRVLRSITPIE